ncbi:MAG: hypothetical protein JO134_10535 [Xanthobacteraceae bacterium]|nr:hypothetical protein [Xanthobacteraceae bacterium]
MAGEARTNIELGKVGDKIIFENDAIRVWSLSVPPGGIKRMHRHGLPYLIVPMTGGRVELTTIDGHVRYGEDKKGEAFFLPAGETHQLRNLNDHAYDNVLVELKSDNRGQKPEDR